MKHDETLPTESNPSGPAPEKPEEEALHLVICWSGEEPHRVGEVAPITGRAVLGRGGPLPLDPAPRVVFYQERPGQQTPMPPLGGPRISRTQLELEPLKEGRLGVRSVGRCELLVGGNPVPRAVLQPGDTITLRSSLVLLLVRRRVRALHAYPDSAAFPFGETDPHGILGESAAAWAMRDALAFAAQSGQHVLLQGESGAGKELAARSIHALSARRGGAFIARNAATFPETLVDAELFGTARGYPNAGSPERPGLVAEADGGTLFLDEIGELPTHLQAHLLRVLDRGGEYQRLGEARSRRSDFRLVAATNRPIDSLKHDIAARLTVRVKVPGLVERREDVPLIFGHLLKRAARETPAVARFFEKRAGELAEPSLDPLLVEALVRHPYTHHVRELERLMWLALSTSKDTFLALTPEVRAELSAAPSAATTQPSARETLGRPEVEAALEVTQGNVTRAARLLGLKNRFVLYRLMKRLGLAVPDDEPDGA